MRTPITQRIEAVLRDAPNSVPYGLPLAFTHRELAIEVYFDSYPCAKPTDAQLAHVRRAVRALVAAGKAKSERPDAWEGDAAPGRRGAPAVVVRRTLTQEDRRELAFHIAAARRAVREDDVVRQWMLVILAEHHRADRESRNVGDRVRKISEGVDRLAPEQIEANHRSKNLAEILLTARASTAGVSAADR